LHDAIIPLLQGHAPYIGWCLGDIVVGDIGQS